VLTYLFCRVNKRDRITLNSICKEIEGTLEDIEYLDVENSKNIILDIAVYILLLIINLDLFLALIFYISNFKVFQRADRVNELNIFSILGACIGLLNFSVLGYKIPFIDLNPLIPIPPNIGFFHNTINVMLSLLFVVFVVSTTIVRFYFNSNSKEQSTDFKSLTELKI
jgi:hypothetical protein